MDTRTTADQLELPFMEQWRKEHGPDAYSWVEEDLICMFEGADLAWMDMLFIDSWFELKDPKSPDKTEVMIFKDRSTEKYFRAERSERDLYQISNFIDKYEMPGLDFFTGVKDGENEIMVVLPEVVPDTPSGWKYL